MMRGCTLVMCGEKQRNKLDDEFHVLFYKLNESLFVFVVFLLPLAKYSSHVESF